MGDQNLQLGKGLGRDFATHYQNSEPHSSFEYHFEPKKMSPLPLRNASLHQLYNLGYFGGIPPGVFLGLGILAYVSTKNHKGFKI